MASTLVIRMSAAQDIGSRGEQQDSVNASLPELQNDIGVICVLSDGMGGLKSGRECSQTVVDTMVRTFHRASAGETAAQILLKGCYLSQQAVSALQETPGESGATLTAVIIRDDRCSFLSVGDSRIYLYRGGSLIQLTRDQNKGAVIDARVGLGYLPEEARSDTGSKGLTSYLGIKTLEMVDRSSHDFTVGPGDRIVLMSDGVFGTLTEDEIEQALQLPEELVANTMIEMVLKRRRPHQDNCTVAVIDCSAPLMNFQDEYPDIPPAEGGRINA